jgi:predicted protein tyrosine phosphatase
MIVNVFSRECFKTKKYNSNEFYICINSTGGPDFSPLLANSSKNIINLWFDDVNKDEYKWGNDVHSWVNAKAITQSQSDKLYNFIKKLPFDSIVNIYCSKGVSRSGAVAEFLKRNYSAIINSKNVIDPNHRVLSFLYNSKNKFIQIINYKVDLDNLLSYYYSLENSYQSFKWTLEYANEVIGTEKHKLNGVYGWGIQSNLEDLSKPCPPYDIHKNGLKDYRNTELVFGFAKKLIKRFPYARQLGVAVHPKHVSISQHVDNDEFVKVHFPIISNTESYFCFGEYKYFLKPGCGYLVDTRFRHGTIQNGDRTRVHLLMKIPVHFINDVLN